MRYQHISDEMLVQERDDGSRAFITKVSTNADYQKYLEWAEDPENEALPADPEPEPATAISREESILATLTESKAFTKEQVVVLARILGGSDR